MRNLVLQKSRHSWLHIHRLLTFCEVVSVTSAIISATPIYFVGFTDPPISGLLGRISRSYMINNSNNDQ